MDSKDRRYYEHCCKGRNNGRWFGLFVIFIGIALLLKRMHLEFIPEWLFSWPVFVIAVGIFLGIRHRFRHFLPYVLIAIGTIFLLKRTMEIPINLEQYIWPLVVIIVGLIIILRPRNKKHWHNDWNHLNDATSGEESSSEQSYGDKIDSTAVFCGTRKNILSKTFKGGDIVIVFGGSELNLSQADLDSKAVLDIVIVFGGLKLTVPSNWEVRTNVMNIAAGIDDKRNLSDLRPDNGKILVLTGTVLFGGIDIQSH